MYYYQLSLIKCNQSASEQIFTSINVQKNKKQNKLYYCSLFTKSFHESNRYTHPLSHTVTLTCPGGSLRNSDEMTSDLTRSEVDICETHLLITTICHSVRWEIVNCETRHKHKALNKGDRSEYHLGTYLMGIITVTGTLNSGPPEGAAVS